jgi:small redox-active disulfide protein 2
VLGGGCAKCEKLEKLTIKAAEELNIEYSIEKVKDFSEIMGTYNVMTTPALVVNEEVVIKGRLPKYEEIKQVLCK